MASAGTGQPEGTSASGQNRKLPRGSGTSNRASSSSSTLKGTIGRSGPPQRQTSAGSAPDSNGTSGNRTARRLSSSGSSSHPRPVSGQSSISQVDEAELEQIMEKLTVNCPTDLGSGTSNRASFSPPSTLRGKTGKSGPPQRQTSTRSAPDEDRAGGKRTVQRHSPVTGPQRSPSPQGASSVPSATRNRPAGSAASWHALDNEAERIREALRLNCSSDPRRDTLEFFNAEVQLRRKERERVGGSFNSLREEIIEKLKEETKLDWTFLNSGSSYDGTKVTRPDEFDCMLFPSIPEECLKICLEKAPPGYCFVEFHPRCARLADEDTKDYLKKLCVQKDGVSLVRSDLYRKEIHGILAAAVDGIRRARAVPNNNPGSPAFPVILNAIPRDNTLSEVSIDFVPGLHLKKLPRGTGKLALKKEDKDAVKGLGFDVTPKQCNQDKSNQSVLWRLSFSRAEKYLTKFADSGSKTAAPVVAQAAAREGRSTCRKEVLRILKRLLEVMKGFDNSKPGQKNEVMVSLQRARQNLSEKKRVSIKRFTTYEIRMLMLREFHVNCPKPEDWTMENRRGRLQHALGELKKMLKGSVVVPHFFLPGVIPDIMADVPQAERKFLYVMFTIAEKLL